MLFNYCKMIFIEIRLTLVIVVTIFALFGIWYRYDYISTDLLEQTSIEKVILDEQIERANTIRNTHILFIGDSSGLMGIDALSLSKQLESQNVESLCTMAWLGPTGYSKILNRTIANGNRPKLLILIFNAAQFDRKAEWDLWEGLVNGEAPKPRQYSFVKGAFVQMKYIIMNSLAYNPLPGIYGQYYGDENTFRRFIANNRGTAIDPSKGLDKHSFAELQGTYSDSSTFNNAPITFNTNALFQAKLRDLASYLKDENLNSVYILITPVPDSSYDATSAYSRKLTELQLIEILDIPEDNILNLPPSIPDFYFSTTTHLNRWGRQYYTGLIADCLESNGLTP